MPRNLRVGTGTKSRHHKLVGQAKGFNGLPVVGSPSEFKGRVMLGMEMTQNQSLGHSQDSQPNHPLLPPAESSCQNTAVVLTSSLAMVMPSFTSPNTVGWMK